MLNWFDKGNTKEERWKIAMLIVRELRRRGIRSLYKISTGTGLNWNTIDFWTKKTAHPTHKNLKKLQKYFQGVCHAKNRKTVSGPSRAERRPQGRARQVSAHAISDQS